MSLRKIHCWYIIISTELKERHAFEQEMLFCCIIIISGLKVSLKDHCHNNSDFKKKHVIKECLKKKTKTLSLSPAGLSTYLRIRSRSRQLPLSARWHERKTSGYHKDCRGKKAKRSTVLENMIN